MDPIERASIIDEGYDPDDPTVRDALDDVVRILADHRHLTGDPELSLEHVLDAARAYELHPEETHAGSSTSNMCSHRLG
ncbi:hypothetical protein A2J03_22235 [Rhodococcus sp. EPR-157]|uniref:hypothetical protein n=1 Tax=Rhodococcus sp. EPR-157 TaxID=1813677 RepID=UPI0007BBD7B5|nr:hypothetical protein [Rhodococcus sp. EPR-157]KZF07762.1 hypothetical protein A2J03_22235 [Rhodococcus sp. EPR-157]